MQMRVKEATGSSSPGKEFVDWLHDNTHIIQSDELQLLLVALYGKNGTDVEFFGDTEEELEEFIEKLTRYGMNCYVERDPEHTELENLAMFLSDEEYEDSDVEEMLEREVVARIFVSRQEYEPRFFDELEDVFNGSRMKYHRKLGEFYGYAEEDIKSFVFENLPVWRRKIRQILGRKPPAAILPSEALEKYDVETTREERRNLLALTNHKIANNRERLEKQLSKVDDIRRVFEEAGVDTGRYIDDMVFEEDDE